MSSIFQKMFLTMALILAFAAIQAQSPHEIVYLKDGSKIKGNIIEQIPDVSLKIQTADGSIFVYPMSDVNWTITDTKHSYDRKRLMRGYRGFFDLGYTIGSMNVLDRLELSTSHGYQFNPYIYAGLGVGILYYYPHDNYDLSVKALEIPVFVHVQSEIFDKPISPFFDINVGYIVYQDKGFYIAPSVGCRFAIGQKVGVHISLGYTMHRVELLLNDADYDYYDYSTTNIGGLNMKIGLDF